MAEDPPGNSVQYEAAYRGSRDAVLSVVSGAIWAVLGVFGAGLLWMTAIALTDGTASPPTFFAALFGAVITSLAGNELAHRLRGHRPVV